MKKRAASLVLCLLLVFRLAVPGVQAADSIFFTAAGIDILPLEDATMPFWYNGYLYVAATIFTGRVNQVLEAAYLPYTASNVCILYQGSRALRFEEGKNYAQTPDGSTFSPGAVRRNGVFCVPVGMVAGYFGFQYSVISLGNPSYTDGKYASLLWLRRPEMSASLGMTEREFARAAAYPMGERYGQYVQAQTPAEPPAAEQPPADLPPEPAKEGKTVFLCLTAGSGAGALLDVLDAYDIKAAFFCDGDFLNRQGDLLRRMTVAGHTVGLLADAGAGDVSSQLEAGNLALELATQGKTRVVRLKNGNQEAEASLQAAGCRLVRLDLDRSVWSLQSQAGGENLAQRISALPGDSATVWLGDDVSPWGLRAFLTAAAQAEHRFLALTETTA